VDGLAVFDLEADGLNPTKIWCIAVKDEKSSRSTSNYDHMRKFFTKTKILVGHNIQRFDVPVVERLLNIKVNALLVDTLALSWYLYPERIRHGLEEWGEEFGIPKPVIKDWDNLSVEEYIHRCEEDVRINTTLWEKMWRDLMDLYEDEDSVWNFIRYLSEKMDCAREQERSGWKLDVDKCKTELESLQAIQAETLAKLTSAMPKVKKYASKSRPAKPFKKDGTYSATGARWFALVRREYPGFNERQVEEFNGTIEELHHEEEGNPKSSIQVKDWLYSLGWKPQTFKYLRDKETGDIREIPQINLEHGAGICPSVSNLYSVEPNLVHLDGLGVVNHRIGLLNGFLNDVDEQGYIKAQVSGLTNTLRFKHKTIVNLPKVGKPYGDVIRGVLIAPDGYELCGSDMASLEDRLKQHYIYPYDPEYVDEMNRSDYDPHLSLALLAGSISAEQMQAYTDGTDKSIKPIRDIFKNGNYACQYGAMPKRLSLTANISIEEATKVWEAYWEKNWAIKKVAEDQVVKKINGQMWLLNPINKFWYSLRYEKDIFSTLVQGSASYVFDAWVSLFRKHRPQITGQFHDEVVLCIREGSREKAEALLRSSIKKLNEELQLNRELDIDVQFGSRYSDIH
jgi:DNA polymerase III epsilon subunit-like protein